jgi:hypothetical protein
MKTMIAINNLISLIIPLAVGVLNCCEDEG